DTATRPHSFRNSPGLEWISSSERHGERSGNDHWESRRERPRAGSRGYLLLHRGRPFSLALFCPQTRRVSEGPKLSGILVGVESGFCLSGGKRRKGIAAYPERRFPGEAFLTGKNRLCNVLQVKDTAEAVHPSDEP